jgi:hypothetical protein
MDLPLLFTLFLQERHNPIYHLSLIFIQLMMVTSWPISATSSPIGPHSPERSSVVGIIEPPPVLARSPLVSPETIEKRHVTRFPL